ncbi:MAG: agmatine deiminase family protein [Planctomycetes bacterium]|nr:agmatine deiminase family protein [Planctomycetota bacterium]
MRRSRFICVSWIALLLVMAPRVVAQTAPTPGPGIAPADWPADAPLPRWREGGPPPDDPGQPLYPFALTCKGAQPKGLSGPPTSGLVASPPEYAPMDGVMFAYDQGWNDVVTSCVVALTADPNYDEKAYVLVESSADQTKAISQFTAAGADMSKVVFHIEPLDSIWLRDYGPHFVWQSGAPAIADSHYYPTRPNDNFIPSLSAWNLFQVPAYPMGLYYSGGNFQPGPDRSGFVTALIQLDNPGFSEDYLLELYHEHQGIDTLHIMPKLPSSVDGTGHIDMWMYLVDDDSVIISQFKPGSNSTAISITDNAAIYMANLGFTVHRPPAWNVGNTHYTYTNAFRVNDRIFIPTYAAGNPSYAADDQAAIAQWTASAGPTVRMVAINCYSIIPAAGAIHCIVMQVPRHTDPVPAAHVVAPDGCELLKSGTTTDLAWTAIDDAAVTSVDLYYSTDGGASFPNTIATGEANDGHFSWTVPATPSTRTVVKVVAHDAAANSVDAVSETPVEVSGAPQSVYDFSTGAGVDRWGWGTQSSSWSAVNGQRHPAAVSTALSPAEYAALSSSNATGGDSDPNRYIAPTPSSSSESTHVFEFTIAENPATIQDIGVTWEGYGDACLQMEVYVWDGAASNWGNGRGDSGQNRYLANYAGNKDEALAGHIRTGFDRYIDSTGKLTLLVYGERSGQESFHDHLSVTVTHTGGPAHPWSDLGNGLAGQFGLPSLLGTGSLQPGQPVNLILANAREQQQAALILGVMNLSAPFMGGLLVPYPNFVVTIPTGTTGNLALSAPWPAGVPAGAQVFLQYWIPDGGGPQGYSATNCVVGTAP